jgi:hypothetical protein
MHRRRRRGKKNLKIQNDKSGAVHRRRTYKKSSKTQKELSGTVHRRKTDKKSLKIQRSKHEPHTEEGYPRRV